MTAPVRATRIAGPSDLSLGPSGPPGLPILRPMGHEPDRTAVALASSVDDELVARAGVAPTMGVVITQEVIAVDVAPEAGPAPATSPATESSTVPATVGELEITRYLAMLGARTLAPATGSVPTPPTAAA